MKTCWKCIVGFLHNEGVTLNGMLANNNDLYRYMTYTPPSYVNSVYRSMNNTNEFMLIFYCKQETFPDQSVYLSEFGLQNTINNLCFSFCKTRNPLGSLACEVLQSLCAFYCYWQMLFPHLIKATRGHGLPNILGIITITKEFGLLG